MLLYYITDRTQFAGEERARREQLLAKIAEAARAGVDFIQLRERDLGVRQLEALAREAVRVVNSAPAPEGRRSRLLINSRVDVVLASGADGVHLRSDDIAVSEVRALWNRFPGDSVLAVSCHTAAEVCLAEAQGADFAVFAPVFEKTTAPQRPGSGLDALREACAGTPAAGRMPVLALGGVTVENARSCLEAGAAGVAGIRLFQESDIRETVRHLREL